MAPTGPEALAYVVDHLPPEFQGVSFVYQWSNRAGFCSRKIKVHLWFWLTEPRTGEELRRWARWWNDTTKRKLADPALYNPVQPHYVADPILPEGVVAPLAMPRTGMILGGLDMVELRVPKGSAGSTPNGAGANLQAITRDDTGKVTDGREGLQVAIRLEVILDEDCPDEEDAFHAEVWRRLNERAVTRATAANPKEWTFGEVRRKGEAAWTTAEEHRKRSGKRPRKPVPGGEPEFPAPCPVPLAVAQEA